MRRTIVIAWTDWEGIEPTGRMVRPDGVNWQAEFRKARRARAVVWLAAGEAVDVGLAEAHARTMGADAEVVRVFAYPMEEADPLGRARRAILGVAAGG